MTTELPETAEAVFFDFGGVFISSPFAAAGAASAKLGLEVEVLTELVFGPYDTDSDHPWHRLERGELAFEAARAEITRLAAGRGLGELDPIVVLSEMGGSGLEIREFMVDAVRGFRAHGLKTGVITNNIAEFGSTWKSLLPIDELFDDIVDSSAVGVRKPDGAIYALACERLGVAPGASWFIDDYQGNVDGARLAGLQAVCCGYTLESTVEALATMTAAIHATVPGLS